MFSHSLVNRALDTGARVFTAVPSIVFTAAPSIHRRAELPRALHSGQGTQRRVAQGLGVAAVRGCGRIQTAQREEGRRRMGPGDIYTDIYVCVCVYVQI